MTASRRPIDEMLTELVAGFGVFGSKQAGANMRSGIAPASIEFDLPIEASVEQRGGAWVVLADSPRTRTRTDFDLPTSRITATITMEPTS